MLHVTVHIGELEARSLHNQLLSLDIAYDKVEALASYLVAMLPRQGSEMAGHLRDYPRWSGSLWDLVARAIAQVVYPNQAIPPAIKPDRRCAYASRICVAVEAEDMGSRGRLLANAEIAQLEGQRGFYRAVFSEDILGERSAEFAYGSKRMDYADFVMRAICWALYDQDTLGPRPKLLLPQTMTANGVECFDVQGLAEPARTGFTRYLARKYPTQAPAALARADDFVAFLFNKS